MGLDSLTNSCISHDGPEKYSHVSEFGPKVKQYLEGEMEFLISNEKE